MHLPDNLAAPSLPALIDTGPAAGYSRYRSGVEVEFGPLPLCSESQATPQGDLTMRFIEMTGKTLLSIVDEDEAPGLTSEQLSHVGVKERSVVRINPQGDIELRRRDGWDVIGGLLGDFEERVRHATGLDWA